MSFISAYVSCLLYITVTALVGVTLTFYTHRPLQWQGYLERRLRWKFPPSPFTPLAYRVGGIIFLLQALSVAIKTVVIILR